MSGNALIPLMGTPVEFGQSANQGAVAANNLYNLQENRRTEPMRMEALKAETDTRKTTAAATRDEQRMKNVIMGAHELKAHAGSIESLAAAVKARKGTLNSLGLPFNDTAELDPFIANGDLAGAQALLDGTIERGYAIGIGERPPKPAGYTNIKQGSDGRTYGLNPETRQFEAIETPGGVELTSQNPVMEQLAMMQAQLALDGKKQSIAAAESAEARAAEKAEREAALAQTEQQSAEQTQRKSRMAAEGLVGLTRELLDDKDGLEAYSGASGMLPTINPSTKTYEAKLGRLLSALTLENTDQLTGILSDTDIKLLQNAATSIVEGGTIEGNRGEIERIMNTLESGLGMPVTSFESAAAPTGQASRRRRSSDFKDTPDDELLSF